MADIDLSGLNIDQLTDLVGKAQSEMASREKHRRKDLRSELERRVAAEGYKMGDIFPEIGNGAANGRQRRKMPAKFRNPQNAEETWTGSGRSPRWVQAILAERGIDMAAFKGIPMYQVRSMIHSNTAVSGVPRDSLLGTTVFFPFSLFLGVSDVQLPNPCVH